MSVNVPIGKGIGKTSNELKFPNLKVSQPEPKNPEKDALSSFEFIRSLNDTGKTIVNTGENIGATNQDLATITVPNGSTFYLLTARVGHTTTSDDELQIDGVTVEFLDVNAQALEFISKPSVLGGSTIAINCVSAAGRNTATLFGYLENSPTPGSRGTISIV